MTYPEGAAARYRGEPVSACPWSPGDPAGREWRQGWLDAEANARSTAGTFGATPSEKAAAGLAPTPTRRAVTQLHSHPATGVGSGGGGTGSSIALQTDKPFILTFNLTDEQMEVMKAAIESAAAMLQDIERRVTAAIPALQP